MNDGGVIETNHDSTPQDQSSDGTAATAATRGAIEKLTNKKAGLKKWIKEKKTTMQGSTVRFPDDAIFDNANRYMMALEAGLVRIENQASRMDKYDAELSNCMLEFGLGCDALAHVDDEIDGVSASGIMAEAGVAGNDESDSPADRTSGIGRAFRLIGETADRASAVLSSNNNGRAAGGGGVGTSRFHERLRDHLRVVQAAKVALSKRNNRLITYSTCLNAVDAKRSSLHKHRISQDHQKAIGVEASLSRAEAAVVSAKANYDEVSSRVLREVDRFRREYAVEMHATMVEFARAQKERYDGMHEVWGTLLPRVEGVNASAMNGSSFAREAAALREGGSQCTTKMPTYPPPPEPVWNGARIGNAMESSMMNGAIRYRDALPEE
jgi:sorting nexin-1/2